MQWRRMGEWMYKSTYYLPFISKFNTECIGIYRYDYVTLHWYLEGGILLKGQIICVNTLKNKIILQHVQPLLCNTWINNGVIQPVSRKRIGKHIPAATNTHATIEDPVFNQRIDKHTAIGVLLETVFSVRFVQNGYNEESSWEDLVDFQRSKWAVSRELSSAKIREKRWQLQERTGLRVPELAVGRWWRSGTSSVERWKSGSEEKTLHVL
jgi:hypothetical protein